MKARFPIGLTYMAKRFPKVKELTEFRIDDILTTTNSKGEIVRIEYSLSHEFMGQRVNENVCDTTIARALGNDGIKPYL